MSRIAVLTDECAKSPEDAISFARQYGLQWVELRGVPGAKGSHYASIPEEQAREAASGLKAAGIRVSFLNTGFFKITLPGTEPVFRKPETPEGREARIAKHKAQYDRRFEELAAAIRNAHIYGVDKMRVFTFLRVQDPQSTFQQVADVIGEMAGKASAEGIKLLVENEDSCNVVTCEEMAAFVKLLPEKSVGINWDPLNGISQKETPYPEGYRLLPKKRILNVQLKGHSLLDDQKKLPWHDIFEALSKDGYKGIAGLETHYFDGTLLEKSHLSMQEIRRIVSES